MDLFGDCCRENSCIRPGIGGQLLLIEFLRYIQCLVRTDVEHPAAVILQFCKIIEKRRILLLFLLLIRRYPGFPWSRIFHACLDLFDQTDSIFSLFKTVLSVQFRTLEITRAFRCLPFCLERDVSGHCPGKYPEEWSFLKIPDLPFSADDHPKDTGHDTADRYHAVFLTQKSGHGPSVPERQCSGEVDPHQIIFFCTKICSVREGIIGTQILRLTYSSADLLFRL